MVSGMKHFSIIRDQKVAEAFIEVVFRWPEKDDADDARNEEIEMWFDIMDNDSGPYLIQYSKRIGGLYTEMKAIQFKVRERRTGEFP